MTSLTQKLASCLITQLYKIECAGEEQIDGDFSVSLMEEVAAELQSLSSDDLSELLMVASKLSTQEGDSARKEFMENFASSFGLDHLVS